MPLSFDDISSLRTSPKTGVAISMGFWDIQGIATSLCASQ